MEDIKDVAIVGAGTMGRGIAHIFALGGYNIHLIDISHTMLERASDEIEKNLQRQVKKGDIESSEAEEALSRIETNTEMDALGEAELIIEAVFERKEIKETVFHEIDAKCSHEAILATNTSSISITEIAAFTRFPKKVIGMHFFNPVPVMKLVEIVRGHMTSDDTYETIFELAIELGKTPVTVHDFPGFISNRLLMPMINEAIFALMEGVATAKDIDTVMKQGMAHPMGPLALADFIGLDVCLDIMEVMHAGLGADKYRPCPLLRKMVAAGEFGRKSGKGFFDYS